MAERERAVLTRFGMTLEDNYVVKRLSLKAVVIVRDGDVAADNQLNLAYQNMTKALWPNG